MKNNTEVLINILKKFPDKNPNPVIQISDFSVLEYFNNPSKEIIEFYGFRINEKINGLIEDHIKKTGFKILNKFGSRRGEKFNNSKSYRRFYVCQKTLRLHLTGLHCRQGQNSCTSNLYH